MWNVTVKKSVQKNLTRLPENVVALFVQLLRNLSVDGPVQTSWPNYSKLGKFEHHCHLNYHYVACWKVTEQTITIEVYYAGSRENAPY
ncbi:MAG TPA: hypothetical protein DDZ11_01850 [Lentisphaeria bacterium]|nr:hypothetical protein [Lentisphaeria bacterium]